MIAFATGGLLGDVFLHLVPHAFFGEGEGADHHAARSVVVEGKRNIVIGCVAFSHYSSWINRELMGLCG
jgi:zinc transporter 7